MHELFAKVLSEKDLSKAGELFNLDDKEIEKDLNEVLQIICNITNSDEYESSVNDQSVIEICITRVTTAIRETETIERHAVALVKVLDICQQHNLKPVVKDEDPPHAKIASDILSCLFMHYNNLSVMEITIPVVVNFLSCDNKDLSRNVSSYLSLAAIDHTKLLGKHIQIILHSILNGIHSLCRVLPQIFSQNRDSIIECTPDLVKILPDVDLAERISLFHVFGSVAQNKPRTLEKHIPSFNTYLSNTSVIPLVLKMYVDIAVSNAEVFQTEKAFLLKFAEQQPAYLGQVSQIIGAIGTLNETEAETSMKYFMNHLDCSDQNVLLLILQEIRALGLNNKKLLEVNMPDIEKLSQNTSSSVRIIIQQMKEDLSKPIVEKKTRSVSSQTEVTGVYNTIITVGNPPNASFPSGTIAVKHTVPPPSSIKSSEQSLAKSSNYRTSSSNPRLSVVDRPVSPISILTSEKASATSTLTLTSSSTPVPLIPVFEPERDGVQHFCEKHFPTIKNFIASLSARIPIPAKCSVVNGKHKRYLKLNFICAARTGQCLYGSNCFAMDTKLQKTWVHLMFLAVQAQSASALGQKDISVSTLKACWDALMIERAISFQALVTSSFPSQKDQDVLLHELHQVRYFDVFEFNAAKNHWACFMCNHPEKMTGLLQDGSPVIAGQLKEKKGKWTFLKRWKTRYFTLSGAHITCNKSENRRETLPVSKIQSVKAVRKGIRDIPKAFEIFTDEQKYMFKAKGQHNVEQWVQCLHIAVANTKKQDDGTESIASDKAKVNKCDTKL